MLARVTVAPGTDREELETAIRRLGGSIRAWADEAQQASVTIPDDELVQLAAVGPVQYVEVAEPLSH